MTYLFIFWGFFLFIHEIDIVKIWNHFIMLLESFVIHKARVDIPSILFAKVS
jgi:hypothetical protein